MFNNVMHVSTFLIAQLVANHKITNDFQIILLLSNEEKQGK